MDSNGSKEPCIRWGHASPRGEGIILGGAPAMRPFVKNSFYHLFCHVPACKQTLDTKLIRTSHCTKCTKFFYFISQPNGVPDATCCATATVHESRHWFATADRVCRLLHGTLIDFKGNITIHWPDYHHLCIPKKTRLQIWRKEEVKHI